jgi:hypothetical protein
MISKTVIRAINTIIEMAEDIIETYYLSLNLISCIFSKLERNSGGYWEQIKI